MYRDALSETTMLSARSVRHAEALLDELEQAVRQGDAPRVNSLGHTLRAIAEGVAGNAVYAGILSFAHHFPFGS